VRYCQPVWAAEDIVRNHHQKTTIEDIEYFMYDAVTVCKPVRLI
jgi:hypothetical protein